MLHLLNTNKRDEHAVKILLKKVQSLKISDIRFITLEVQGMVSLKSKIYLGLDAYKIFSFIKVEKPFLVTVLIHEIGHFLIQQIQDYLAGTPDFVENAKTIQESEIQKIQLKPQEEKFIMDIEAMEGGFAFSKLIFGHCYLFDYVSTDGNSQDQKLLAKVLDIKAYESWPIFSDKDLVEKKRTEKSDVNYLHSGMLVKEKRRRIIL